MQKSLQVLIVIGMALWIFLLMEKYHMLPNFTASSGPRVDDATKTARCAEFEHDVEGDRVMGYGDRIRQFGSGCW